MKRYSLALLVLTVSLSLGASTFPDSAVPLPANWSGPVFHLSQSYPLNIPADTYPWSAFDPKTQPDEYMAAVLKYCLEGNDTVDWDIRSNPARPWFHAPWMHWGAHGREPIHGLTFERMSLPHELAPGQTGTFQNWAVGMYNAPGGYTIGQVWSNPNSPTPGAAKFPLNTVSIKLLFTEGTPAQVPYLNGSKTWQAYIYANPQQTGPGAARVVKTLYLLQVDVAIRDPRVDATSGWVFGTFVYDGRAGATGYAGLKPVGLMWGNDPTYTSVQQQQGAKLQETYLSPQASGVMQHYGWLGRLDGPVDNPKSSCLSCHSTAQWPVAVGMTPPNGTAEGSAGWMKWFQNIPASTAFSAGSQSLDYSLQLASGVQNFTAWSNECQSHPSATIVPPCPAAAHLLEKKRRAPTPLGFPVHR